LLQSATRKKHLRKTKRLFGQKLEPKRYGRYNTSYLWQISMVDGIIDAATVIDAQINTYSSLKST
jgi:hypothetical protein